jgi:hypothetical protein
MKERKDADETLPAHAGTGPLTQVLGRISRHRPRNTDQATKLVRPRCFRGFTRTGKRAARVGTKKLKWGSGTGTDAVGPAAMAGCSWRGQGSGKGFRQKSSPHVHGATRLRGVPAPAIARCTERQLAEEREGRHTVGSPVKDWLFQSGGHRCFHPHERWSRSRISDPHTRSRSRQPVWTRQTGAELPEMVFYP